MPKRTDISSILVIGAGPIVIGQACEFDYSSTRSIKLPKGLSPAIRFSRNPRRFAWPSRDRSQSLARQSIRLSMAAAFRPGASVPSIRRKLLPRVRRTEPVASNTSPITLRLLRQEPLFGGHRLALPRRTAVRPGQSTTGGVARRLSRSMQGHVRLELASAIRSTHSYRRGSKIETFVRHPITFDFEFEAGSRNPSNVINEIFARHRFQSRRKVRQTTRTAGGVSSLDQIGQFVGHRASMRRRFGVQSVGNLLPLDLEAHAFHSRSNIMAV